MDGIELALRFSYITNVLRFCGPQEAKEQFLRYSAHKDNPKEVTSSLKRFEGLYPYLDAIASKHEKDFLDYDVVEAYWIGNELLDTFSSEDLKKIIHSLTKRGLPPSIAKKQCDALPPGAFPHHNFNVLHVGVGNTTGSVEPNVQNMDNCRTSWGTVLDVFTENCVVETQPLVQDGTVFSLGPKQTKTAVYLPQMLPDLQKGDCVALHWGYIPCVLSQTQVSNLKKYTQKLFDVLK